MDVFKYLLRDPSVGIYFGHCNQVSGQGVTWCLNGDIAGFTINLPDISVRLDFNVLEDIVFNRVGEVSLHRNRLHVPVQDDFPAIQLLRSIAPTGRGYAYLSSVAHNGSAPRVITFAYQRPNRELYTAGNALKLHFG